MQVSPYRRGKSLMMSIYTDERPDLSRELPNWMFDERYCGEMRLGPPRSASLVLMNWLRP